MKTIHLFIAMLAITFSLCMIYDSKCYAEPPRPATDTTQDIPGPMVSEPDTGKKPATTRTKSAKSSRKDHDKARPDYGWFGLLGLAGLVGLAGKNKKD